ncbi:hypothetical protein K469DRAFT_551842 [Zopfia rhizophila CBS 207.26]|uniref:Inhibitor I9 domain-containing protein n=1 Tax=Zopfia rhizophila CBS 207.26 TaxID=1314779 RepID=A0A6A6EQ68_9PEZI|nr:hypothetical protein K469DRAFT_551842 [Zopfia rhizophila CBS 207.26]
MPALNVSLIKWTSCRHLQLTVILQVTLKSGASPEELENAKKSAIDQGGKITNEFTLIKAFTVEFPADKVHTLETNDHVTVEPDSVVTTQ